MHSEEWADPRDPRGHRGHRRGRVRVGPGWGSGPEFGLRGGPFGPPFGPPRFGGRGPRVRRGDVRAAILDLLAEGQPWNGYQIIQEIGARTQGVWRPSAVSVYPALQQLEASWDAVTGSVNDTEVQLRHTIHQVMVAVSQVAQAGSAAQVQQAGKILADTRRALYRILATDGEDVEEDSQG